MGCGSSVAGRSEGCPSTPRLRSCAAALIRAIGWWGSPAYERCKTLKKTPRENDGCPCPSADEDAGVRCFDTTYAYELYQTLFGQVEDLIKDKHLLIVPSKALTQLPFYVLVTEKPEAGRSGKNDFAEIKWLVNRQSVAVLPSVGKSRRAAPDAADAGARALIGFGDPLLDGRPDDPAQARRASEAPRATELRANRQRARMGNAAGRAAGRIIVSWAVRRRPGPASANAAAGDDR